MFEFLKSMFKEKNIEDLEGRVLYLCSPTILYHTRTEKKCIKFLEKKFTPTHILNPSDFKIHDISFYEKLIKKSEIVVGLTILDKYSLGVWKEMEIGEKFEKKIYSLRVIKTSEFRRLELEIKEGYYPFEKLDWEETKRLYRKIEKSEFSPLSFLIGRRRIF